MTNINIRFARVARCAGAAFALLCLGRAPLDAQDRAHDFGLQTGGVPLETAREIVGAWNARGMRRVRGDFTLDAGDTVRSNLAILGGQSRIAGVVLGNIVIINGDLQLAVSARLDRDLTIVGGELDFAGDRPNIGGNARVWSARIRYHESADSLVADDRELFGRFRRASNGNGTRSDFLVTTAHTYNRVEGLPIHLGPRLRARNGDTRVSAEILGIFRTANRLAWKQENIGHSVNFEVREGRRASVTAGGRVFDEIDAVEAWQLNPGEVGLASLLFTRDYRDYWQRHGGLGFVAVSPKRGSELRVSYGQERWTSRDAVNAPSLIDNDVPWRVNPRVDEGVMSLVTVSGDLDSRNNADAPKSGWLLHAEYEYGSGTLQAVGATTRDVRAQGIGDIAYGRIFADFRRYNRLGPNGQLNLRAVGGGWLSGDPLPLQRRFAVSGVDALPGFDFRRVSNNADVGTCATGSDAAYAALGRPAQCERMVLLQAEWKGNFRVNPFGREDRFGDRRYFTDRLSADGAWVLFVNSGRGWLLGDRGDLRVGTGRVPDIGTWRTDLGGGFDFGGFGVYVAQAVSERGMNPNVFVRLARRF